MNCNREQPTGSEWINFQTNLVNISKNISFGYSRIFFFERILANAATQWSNFQVVTEITF